MSSKDLQADVGSWPTDETEYLLLSLVILFSPINEEKNVSNCNLEDTQLEYLTLLQKYLDKKYASDPDESLVKFTRCIDILRKCKEIHFMLAGRK